MYQKILVPIDGSPTASLGLAEAIKLARLCGARLRLLHIVDELSLAMATGYGVTYQPDVLQVLEDAGAELLRKAEEQVRAAGVPVDSVLANNLQGSLRDQVIAQAQAWQAELIVLGTHGRRGAQRLFFGSDAESILRSAPVPVLLVRGQAPTATP